MTQIWTKSITGGIENPPATTKASDALSKKHPWRDSNPRSSAPETDALATGPQGRPPTGVWTQVFGVRIRRAHHYTIGGNLITSNDSNPQRLPKWVRHCKEASVTVACIIVKTYITCDSRVVPHRSTEQAQWCLTSEFGWDPVVSPWYERTMSIIKCKRNLTNEEHFWQKSLGRRKWVALAYSSTVFMFLWPNG